MTRTQISVWEVKGIFSRLKVTKVKGPDNLSPRVRKECAEELEVFQWIFNMSMRSGEKKLLTYRRQQG